MLISSSEWVLGDRPTALARTRAAGFDAIELDATPGVDLARLRDDLAEAGLVVPSLCWGWSSERELGSPDAASRRTAQEYLRDSLELAASLGASQLVVLPACRNTPWDDDEPRERGLERAGAAIAEVLADAPADVTVALEALHREESFLMNTLDDAQRLRALVGDARVGLVADLYHMVHEEDDMLAALRRHADAITLVHLAARERGPLLASTPGIEAIVAELRALPSARSATLEFLVRDDDALLAESIAFARTL
jgi:sugar phosphate isomerase/epimerase